MIKIKIAKGPAYIVELYEKIKNKFWFKKKTYEFP